MFLNSDDIFVHKKLSQFSGFLILLQSSLTQMLIAENSEKNVLRTRLTSKTIPAVLANTNSGTVGKHNISSVFPVSPQTSLASGFARDAKGQGGKLRIRKDVCLRLFFSNRTKISTLLFTEPPVIKTRNFLHFKEANYIQIL